MIKTSISKEYQQRRDTLMSRHPGAAFLLPAAPEIFRGSSVALDYRQDSSLYYLTGFDQPQAFLAMIPDHNQPKGYKSIFFCAERNPQKELWDGEMYGTDRALKVFHMDECHDILNLESKLPNLLTHVEHVYYHMGQDEEGDRLMQRTLEKVRMSKGRSGKGLISVHDPKVSIGELRLKKSEHEIELMKKAAKISSDAHIEAIKQAKAGLGEGQMQALIEYHFKFGGCKRTAYNSIVAAGSNATYLHYHSNDDVLKDGELLLIDAGGEYEFYHSDITRTFPIGKTFSSAQKEIYSIVLKAQKQTIDRVKPGVRFHDLHVYASKVLIEGLCDLGLLTGTVDVIFDQKKHLDFYPHGTGHFLGLDTHDTGLYYIDEASRKLEPGMVFTVEPGLYIQKNHPTAPEKYHGIGIRIEDDVLVTETGCEVLTTVPKEIEEIESLRHGK